MSSSAVKEVRKAMPERFTRLGWGLLAAGLALSAAAYSSDALRSSFNNVVLFLFLASIAVGAIFLVALEYLAGAVWSVPMRRVNEMLAALVFIVPLAAIPMFFNLHDLFHWTHAEAVNADPVLSGKKPYLNVEFFVIRFGAIFLLWWVFAFFFRRNSSKQDTTHDPALTRINIRLGALFMPVFAITVTFLAIDWAMSLEPHWFSTIFGVYYFSGTVLAAVAAGTYIILKLHEAGRLPGLRRDHRHTKDLVGLGICHELAHPLGPAEGKGPADCRRGHPAHLHPPPLGRCLGFGQTHARDFGTAIRTIRDQVVVQRLQLSPGDVTYGDNSLS